MSLKALIDSGRGAWADPSSTVSAVAMTVANGRGNEGKEVGDLLEGLGGNG